MGKCKFQKDWLAEYKWLEQVKNDTEKAKCKLCNKGFSVANKGIANVKQHQQTSTHQSKENAAANTVAIDRAFQSKIVNLFDYRCCCFH